MLPYSDVDNAIVVVSMLVFIVNGGGSEYSEGSMFSDSSSAINEAISTGC